MLEVIREGEKALFTVAETESVDEGWLIVLDDSTRKSRLS